MDVRIREGRVEDAGYIARTVMGAIGDELCAELGGGEDRICLVEKVFRDCAISPFSQYSYRNSLIAEGETGGPIGCIVAYDGAKLHELRRIFAENANRYLGWEVTHEDVENWDDETSPDEIYIDSLYVSPEARGMGIASKLIDEVKLRYIGSGKPIGLLCEPENRDAYGLYISKGFREVGVSRFFHTPMIHLLLDPSVE